MQFPARHVFRMYNSCGRTCSFRLVTFSACTISAEVHALSRLSRFSHVQFLRAYMQFPARHVFRMYNSCGRTCSFRLVTFSACTISAEVHALFGLPQFPHALFLPGYMRFPACHDFRTYYFRGKTCAFALIMLFACTISVGVHALFGSSRFPHILVTPAYMHFSACHTFRMYYFCRSTCDFRLVTLSARTISAGRHALSRLSQFLHVQFPRACMRFRACLTFRTYNSHGLACAFALIPFSARTSHAGVHAISGLSRFPHVLFLPRYMRFLAYLIFRTYHFCQGTCGFQLATISACTILTGLHAVSHLSRFSHILGTPGSASTGCNCLNCLNM